MCMYVCKNVIHIYIHYIIMMMLSAVSNFFSHWLACGVGFERIFYTVTEPNTSGGKKLLQVCIMKNGSHSQKDITVVVVASDIPNTPLEQRATGTVFTSVWLCFC